MSLSRYDEEIMGGINMKNQIKSNREEAKTEKAYNDNYGDLLAKLAAAKSPIFNDQQDELLNR
jgi:hypothetical protein